MAWLACIDSYLAAHAFVNMVLGSFIGALLSVPVAWLFYRKASKDLRAEAAALRKEAEELRGVTAQMWERVKGMASYSGRGPH
jgi:hypothetical protein